LRGLLPLRLGELRAHDIDLAQLLVDPLLLQLQAAEHQLHARTGRRQLLHGCAQAAHLDEQLPHRVLILRRGHGAEGGNGEGEQHDDGEETPHIIGFCSHDRTLP
jgi:hypothetical protein